MPLESRPRPSFATILAFAGLVAIAVGWALPWFGAVDVAPVGADRVELRAFADGAKNGVPEDVSAVARRVLDGASVSGNQLATLGRFWLGRRGGIDPVERRAWTAGLLVLRLAPWTAAAAALLLLLGRLRRPASPVLAWTLFVAASVLGFAGIVGLGASENARRAVIEDPSRLAVGVWSIAGGIVTAILGGLAAVTRKTWWRAYLLAFVLVVASIAAIWLWVRPT